MTDSYYELPHHFTAIVNKIKGPIMVFGAGGFIGTNLVKSLLLYRDDVYAVSQSPKVNWRFNAAHIAKKNLLTCDINDLSALRKALTKIKPQTIYSLAAYGAYAKQSEYQKIYLTNFNAVISLIELVKEYGFSAFIQAGSQSEYGLNCAGPSEDDELIPNSHYAVSKVAASYAIKHYGKVHHLPVVNFRIYSAYGPWEEPDRLIPVLLDKAGKGEYPPFVNPMISRDFIYISDIVSAFIMAASQMKPAYYGESINLGTGQKTTIKELAYMVKEICGLSNEPEFRGMKNRDWDLQNWYATITKMQKELKFSPIIPLRDGLVKTIAWQKDINYSPALWS